MIPIEIRPNILMLKGIGLDSNIYFLKSGEELLIVDTGTGVYWNRYVRTAESEGWISDIKRVIIFNTHEHFDHVGGNKVFKEFFQRVGAKVEFASSRKTAETLERGDDYIILSFYYGRKFESHKVERKLKEGDRIKIGNVELTLVETPGHTRGSACLYYEEEEIMFTGDTIFAGTYGRTDLPTGDEKSLLESLEKLLEFRVRLGLPGHGKVIQNWKENIERVLAHLGV
ncbi:MBL fold metallo-hydrolase [Pyrococcus sp. ST04]|uniref:MBL fold metallo-hydrolase n=1 Tax=Pyrococcus sp. ST04 TaxID=1183377 RepID=UPI0002605DA4|nr:MBL fold metallo-hydrolase [Pyrococcus sp. ST04]AFK22499.1 putative hydroxyacylglutathione hydrolase (glyoxalase II) [Pyrococcus sp. ST04]